MKIFRDKWTNWHTWQHENCSTNNDLCGTRHSFILHMEYICRL